MEGTRTQQYRSSVTFSFSPLRRCCALRIKLPWHGLHVTRKLRLFPVRISVERKPECVCVCCHPVSRRCCLLLLTAGKRKERTSHCMYCSQTAGLWRSKAASVEPGVTGVNYVDQPSVTNNRHTGKTVFVTVGMKFLYGGCFSASFHSPPPPPQPPAPLSGVSWPLPLA